MLSPSRSTTQSQTARSIPVIAGVSKDDPAFCPQPETSMSAATRTGWSVIVNGTLDVVDDTTELDRLGHQSWAPLAGEPLWMQLRPLDISGREIPTTAR